MSAKRQPAKLESEQPRPNTRRATRRIAEAVGTVRSSHGDRSRVRIRDVSVYGCNLAGDADWLRTGMFVSVQLASDWSIQAVVRWARDGTCGIEFLRPISDSDARAIACE
ncbi:MAG: PilZ domain-containing protein [Novosphingobium sp.]|uniref:PilZ domain-containing protein n=1 Tax=Novosphingobium sp. TaxID=1874826 RepID=UPI0032BE69D7